MSEYESRWVSAPDDAEAYIRKPERKDRPRAAREADLEARLYAIKRKAAMEFQEREDAA